MVENLKTQFDSEKNKSALLTYYIRIHAQNKCIFSYLDVITYL